MEQETKQYEKRRIKLFDMKPEYLVQPGEHYFSPKVVNAFIDRVNAGKVLGETEMRSQVVGLVMGDLVTRSSMIKEERTAIHIQNAVLRNGVVFADVTPAGPYAHVAEDSFTKLAELGLSPRRALAMRTMCVHEADGPMTVNYIVTFDLHSEPLMRQD